MKILCKKDFICNDMSNFLYGEILFHEGEYYYYNQGDDFNFISHFVKWEHHKWISGGWQRFYKRKEVERYLNDNYYSLRGFIENKLVIFEDYFLTDNEIRKLKLDKLNESIM